MGPPRKRQKTSNIVINKDTNTGTARPSGDRPVRQTKSRFSRPRQPSASTSGNNKIIDEHSQNEHSNAVLNIDYAKLAAEVLRQPNSNQNVQLDTRDNVADNRNDSVTPHYQIVPFRIRYNHMHWLQNIQFMQIARMTLCQLSCYRRCQLYP